MGRHETDRPRVDAVPSAHKTKEDDEQESEENKKSVARKMRHSRSSVASPSPPKKKHRLREQTTAKEGETRSLKKLQRPGVPQETPKSELRFPNRYSPPQRAPDEHGFYRFRYGENLTPRYKIISKLGEGTFGLVLECWDRMEKCFVAMKIIRNIEKYRAAAMVELEVLNTIKINDPDSEHHCIAINKWFNYRGHVCMAFEKHGPSLYDFLKKNNYNPFEIDVVRDIGYQLLKAVAFLHDLNLVHTDLKPENILFVKDGYERRSASPNSVSSGLRVPSDALIRVIDFGSATFEDGHHGRIVSTRHYRAPEVVLGIKWGDPCDLWSVGCILVELITGETLFQTHEDIEHLAMMEQVLGRIPKSLAERCDHPSKRYFHFDHQLNWPDGASSRKSIRAVRRLLSLRDWVAEVGDKSVKSCLDDFVDLVASLMRFEPAERLSAKEALQHKFFSSFVNGTEAY